MTKNNKRYNKNGNGIMSYLKRAQFLIHKKILTVVFPDRDFSNLYRVSGRGKGRPYMCDGYCYKIFGIIYKKCALREAAMAQVLRKHLTNIEIPDMKTKKFLNLWIIVSYPIIEGEILSDFWTRAEKNEKMRIAGEIGTLLAQIHSIDINGIPEETKKHLSSQPIRIVSGKRLEKYKPFVDKKYHALLDCQEMFREDVPGPYGKPHLIHGDWHNANIIVRNKKIAGLIDFGTSCISDKTYRDFRKVMYTMDESVENEIIKRYEENSKITVDKTRVAAGLIARIVVSGRRKPISKSAKNPRFVYGLERVRQIQKGYCNDE